MREMVLAYFAGEKHAAVALMIAALVGLGASAALFPARWELRSFSITLAVFSLIVAGIGIGLYLKTGPQLEKLLAELQADANTFFAAETARMRTVQRSFTFFEFGEIVVITAAMITALVAKQRAGLVGVASGFLISAAFLLSFDLIAERRGAVYLAALEARR